MNMNNNTLSVEDIKSHIHLLLPMKEEATWYDMLVECHKQNKITSRPTWLAVFEKEGNGDEECFNHLLEDVREHITPFENAYNKINIPFPRFSFCQRDHHLPIVKGDDGLAYLFGNRLDNKSDDEIKECIAPVGIIFLKRESANGFNHTVMRREEFTNKRLEE